MSKVWSLERLKKAKFGVRVATYEAIPANSYEAENKEKHPHLFKFEALSIGDESGQAFLVPLDESSKETAELIIKAIAAYQGGGQQSMGPTHDGLGAFAKYLIPK